MVDLVFVRKNADDTVTALEVPAHKRSNDTQCTGLIHHTLSTSPRMSIALFNWVQILLDLRAIWLQEWRHVQRLAKMLGIFVFVDEARTIGRYLE